MFIVAKTIDIEGIPNVTVERVLEASLRFKEQKTPSHYEIPDKTSNLAVQKRSSHISLLDSLASKDPWYML